MDFGGDDTFFGYFFLRSPLKIHKTLIQDKIILWILGGTLCHCFFFFFLFLEERAHARCPLASQPACLDKGLAWIFKETPAQKNAWVPY